MFWATASVSLSTEWPRHHFSKSHSPIQLDLQPSPTKPQHTCDSPAQNADSRETHDLAGRRPNFRSERTPHKDWPYRVQLQPYCKPTNWNLIPLETGEPWVLALMERDETTQPTIIDQLRQRKAYLSTTEVMAILRINRATLCGYCRASLIPHIRMPDFSYRFDPVALHGWLSERTVG